MTHADALSPVGLMRQVAVPAMPELPEVEVVRRGLQQHVVGRTIDKVSVLHPRAVRRHLAGPADFAAPWRAAPSAAPAAAASTSGSRSARMPSWLTSA